MNKKKVMFEFLMKTDSLPSLPQARVRGGGGLNLGR